MSVWLKNAHGNSVVVLMDGKRNNLKEHYAFLKDSIMFLYLHYSLYFFLVPFVHLSDFVCSLFPFLYLGKLFYFSKI